MTDAAGPPTSAPGLGVVDPIRIPGARLVGAIWARLPVLGRVFVVLALIDVIARAFGLFGERLAIDAAIPFTFVSAFLPRELLILLPAILLARRADAAQATPLVFRGAVLVALVELLRGPVTGLPLGADRGDVMLSWTLLASLATILAAAGWVTISFGLADLNPRPARPSIDGFSNLAAGALVAGAAAWLLEIVIGTQLDLGDPRWNTMMLVVSAVAPVQLVAWAFVARVAVRGMVDTRRPAIATTLGATAMALAAIAAALIVVEVILMAAQYLGLPIPVISGMLGLGWLAGGLVPTLLVVAFGLGLADASVRIPGVEAAHGAPIEPDVEPLSWPAAGGEVPVYRDLPPTPTSPPKEPHP